ncbi:MAG TPA: acetyl-CoA hydrolase/transferase family protein [Halanaerobiales bacterium]|nr:acetyl-CoA hydrolase/transferase family protein [Halanaerobiales bacterium]
MDNRIRNKKLHKKICSAEEAASLIKDNMVIGCSGFTPSGYPKAVPLALTKKIEKSAKSFKIDLLTGASVGKELDGKFAQADLIRRRYPYYSDKFVRKKINKGKIAYKDAHLSHFPQQIRYGYYGDIDIAIIEATAITKDINIIPTTSVGVSPVLASKAKEIIVEINTNKPVELEGIHDIYQPLDPPDRKPIPLKSVDDRIGNSYIEVDAEKIKAIVYTNLKDDLRLKVFQNNICSSIAHHIIKFLEDEVRKNRLPNSLLPLQSGVGQVANAVLAGLEKSNFKNLSFYSEVIQDSVLDLIDSGKINIASGTSITTSPAGYQRFLDNIDFYKNKIILRPQEISNNPEIIRRLGSVAINTAVEVDIYGNINSTNIMGTKMMNGIGGSGDFARNAFLSIFVTSSTAKEGKISSIVPMVSHVDHTEHDIDIIVTENGIADLRGLAPRERAELIIDKCAHIDYKDQLRDYLNRAKKLGGHTPHLLDEALAWHQRYIKTGTMLDI